MSKVNNKDTRTTPMASFWCLQWCPSGVFIVNFEHFTPCSSVSIVNFEHVIAGGKGSIFECAISCHKKIII